MNAEALTIYKPVDSLAPYVHYFWFYQSYHPGHTHEKILPYGAMEMQLNLSGDGFWVGEPTAAKHFTGWMLSGGYSRPFVTRTAQPMNIISVLFKPLANRILTHYPAHELHNQHVDLGTFWGASANQSAQHLMEISRGGTQNIQTCFAFVEQMLHKRLQQISSEDKRLRSLGLLVAQNQQLSSKQLCEYLDCSAPTLIRYYKQYLGISPRHFLRLQRLQTSLYLMAQQPSLSKVEVALVNGYTDQAHFNHEFRKMLGFTPSDYCPQHPEHALNIPYPIC